MSLLRSPLISCVALVATTALPLGAQSWNTGTRAPGAMAGFGGALAVGDGEILVGEAANTLRSGMVYVYRKRGTAWQEAATLTAPDARPGDGFGSSIAIEGGVMIVGSRAGTPLHVFRRQTNGTWRHSGTVGAADVAERDYFGATLAAAGEWLLVGAPGQGERTGAVYVFRRGANGQYAQAAKLAPADAAEGDAFGGAIAVAGARAVIGAPNKDQRAGAAYIFEAEAGGAWKEVGRISARGLQRLNGYGTTVAMSGETALVGAPGHDGARGAVFGFRRGAETGTWTEDSRLVAWDGAMRDAFGTSLAAAGSELWIGAPGARTNGGAYVFSSPASAPALSMARMLVAPTQGRRDQFGAQVAVRGSLAAVAALGVDHGAGAVVVYERAANGQWREAGSLESPPEAIASLTGRERKCSAQGNVDVFRCSQVELLAFLPVKEIAIDGRGVELNDIWGWTDPQTGKEYALVGRVDGTSFVDISNPTAPVFVGELPMTEGARPASWRDIKVYRDHAYIVADGAGAHGMQVFDLTRLRNVPDAPASFTPDTTYRRINSAHNIVINEESGFAYSVGSSMGGETCGGGLHMIDIREPKSPAFAGCFADTQTGSSGTGYSHDAQCVTYRGPDQRYAGREICLGSNETALSIADVTDKQNPQAISRASYPNVGYTHQGWLSEDHRWFYMNDEGDEMARTVPRTRTLVWDLADLEDPRLVKEHLGTAGSIDHNLYVKGNLIFQSNYNSGLRILDISDPGNPKEVGWFDTAPFFDDDTPSFNGTWSNYPFFKSGTIAVSSIGEGLFLVKKREGNVVF